MTTERLCLTILAVGRAFFVADHLGGGAVFFGLPRAGVAHLEHVVGAPELGVGAVFTAVVVEAAALATAVRHVAAALLSGGLGAGLFAVFTLGDAAG